MSDTTETPECPVMSAVLALLLKEFGAEVCGKSTAANIRLSEDSNASSWHAVKVEPEYPRSAWRFDMQKRKDIVAVQVSFDGESGRRRTVRYPLDDSGKPNEQKLVAQVRKGLEQVKALKVASEARDKRYQEEGKQRQLLEAELKASNRAAWLWQYGLTRHETETGRVTYTGKVTFSSLTIEQVEKIIAIVEKVS